MEGAAGCRPIAEVLLQGPVSERRAFRMDFNCHHQHSPCAALLCVRTHSVFSEAAVCRAHLIGACSALHICISSFCLQCGELSGHSGKDSILKITKHKQMLSKKSLMILSELKCPPHFLLLFFISSSSS